MSLTMLQRIADGPFEGCVSRNEIAARIAAIDLGEQPSDMRRGFARLLRGDAAGTPPSVGRALNLGGVDGLWIPPPVAAAKRLVPGSAPVVVWMHGGGYVFGSPQTHWRVGAAIAAMASVAVFLPRYRLAPEHPWPAQLDDAKAVVRALQGVGQRVLLGGDSAGGHLALTTALALAREGHAIDALLLCSPNTDRSGLNKTRRANSARDAMNDDEQDTALARLAFGAMPVGHPEVSPLLDDLSLLPPTHIEVGEHEVLQDDALLLARRGQAAGARVDCHVERGVLHMWQLWTPWFAPANTSIARLAAFIRTQLR